MIAQRRQIQKLRPQGLVRLAVAPVVFAAAFPDEITGSGPPDRALRPAPPGQSIASLPSRCLTRLFIAKDRQKQRSRVADRWRSRKFPANGDRLGTVQRVAIASTGESDSTRKRCQAALALCTTEVAPHCGRADSLHRRAAYTVEAFRRQIQPAASPHRFAISDHSGPHH